MEPMDELFAALGNAFIKLCDGFTNQNSHNTIIDTLKKDVEEVVELINKEGSDENKELLQHQMSKLKKLGDDAINSAEGVVFVYKDKLMKLTGSFASLNQILGIIKFGR